jgi:hypothetical protein
LYRCSRISQHCKEFEGSLPCSQEPSTDSDPEPDESNSHHPHPIFLRSISIQFTRTLLGLPNGLFLSGLFTRILYVFLPSSIRATCPENVILLALTILIILCEEYKFWSRYAALSNLLSIHLSSVPIFSFAPCFATHTFHLCPAWKEESRGVSRYSNGL